jgi:hypothetical protein
VEAALCYFGKGNSNEGSEESKAILRYYVEPNDKRFRKIYLNFDQKRNITSIVWFLSNDSELKLAHLEKLFGSFTMHNIIYDETTDFIFLPNRNEVVKSVKTNIPEWVRRRSGGTLYFKKANEEFDLDSNYDVSDVQFLLSSE